MNGKISKYLSFRGYGFINTKEYEKDIFFHSSNYPPRQLPVQNQLVEFDIKETTKGLEAVNIKIIHDLPSEDTVQEGKDDKLLEKTSSKENDLDKLKGIGPIYKTLLEKAQVKTCQNVAGYKPEKLFTKLLAINNEEQITKRPPTLNQINDWIDKASKVVE